MPIDDSDMGCDCAVKCEISGPWKRQIAAITIDDERDAVTDNGQELVNLFAERGVDPAAFVQSLYQAMIAEQWRAIATGLGVNLSHLLKELD